ncbi:proteoglycan 4-like [Thamnophis elegans]|uniref:proteoglycan 4-like n=1 Tax=Thamnophis elegans TaxID=35005 RepID=UPI00137822CF|nr:proteoglycan 4-like [Thamnophis elegans]
MYKISVLSKVFYYMVYYFERINGVIKRGATSCAGRCAEGYSRTPGCQCDSNCQLYQECCDDYEQVCLAELSCKGHCTDRYVRGRPCDCDPDCHQFGKCCPD